MCLGNISKELTVNDMKKARLKGSLKRFSVIFNPIDISDISDILR